jgi:hypothetical protein
MFAIHTIHIFQILDVMLLIALKKHNMGLETLDEGPWAAAFLFKMYRDFKQTMIEVDMWKTFAAIGFTHYIDQFPYGRLFDEEKFQQSSGFAELWDHKKPLKSL